MILSYASGIKIKSISFKMDYKDFLLGGDEIGPEVLGTSLLNAYRPLKKPPTIILPIPKG